MRFEIRPYRAGVDGEQTRFFVFDGDVRITSNPS